MQQRIFGQKAEPLATLLHELDPDVGRWAQEFAFGDVWAREDLAFEERLLVAVVSLTVLGRIDQLRSYLFAALRAGMPEEKVQHALAMTCVYAGFPAALNGLVCWREVKLSHARRAGDQPA
jgi:4-carboxymuconolactone decarboxylase